jgi:hypothetical protein
MNKLSKVLAGLALSLAVAGCSMVKKSGGGGGGGEATGPVGDTMADAVVHARGASFTVKPACHTSGYARLDIPAGEPITLELTVTSPGEEACVSFWFLNKNGGDGGLTAEACSTSSPFTYEVTAQEEASFLQVSEAGKCQGAEITVAIK